MASWGNSQNSQFQQDMDSAGQKLKVNGNSGGGTNYQTEISDSNIVGNALKVDGEQHLWRGGNLIGRIKPSPDAGEFLGILSINHGNGAGQPADRSIIIGQAESNPPGGNVCWIRSRLVSVGGNGTADEFNDTYPVALNGPVCVGGLNGLPGDEVAMKTEGLIISTGLKLPAGEDVMQIGKTNRTAGNHTTINIGEGAGAASGRGSQVNIRGDLTIQPGDVTNPGNMIVPGQLSCGGNFTAGAVSYLNGAVDIGGIAQIDGNLTVERRSSLQTVR